MQSSVIRASSIRPTIFSNNIFPETANHFIFNFIESICKQGEPIKPLFRSKSPLSFGCYDKFLVLLTCVAKNEK